MIEPMFRVEMTPMDRTKKNGGSSTTFPISGRVLIWIDLSSLGGISAFRAAADLRAHQGRHCRS